MVAGVEMRSHLGRYMEREKGRDMERDMGRENGKKKGTHGLSGLRAGALRGTFFGAAL